MNITKIFLIVDNETNEVLDWHDELKVAKQAIKERYPDDRIVRAVCEEYDNGDCSPWSCGKTFAEAERNLKKGIFDNQEDY